MSTPAEIVATAWKESSGTCACCGHGSKTVWGDLSIEATTLAVYFVQWTVGVAEHDVNVDLIVGAWGEGTTTQDRVLVSVLYRPSPDGGSFMVIDGEGRYPGKSKLCSRAMRRAEVVGTPFSQEVFTLLDSLWLTDRRLAEVRALNNVA